jgi:hypothetical protein
MKNLLFFQQNIDGVNPFSDTALNRYGLRENLSWQYLIPKE